MSCLARPSQQGQGQPKTRKEVRHRAGEQRHLVLWHQEEEASPSLQEEEHPFSRSAEGGITSQPTFQEQSYQSLRENRQNGLTSGGAFKPWQTDSIRIPYTSAS